MKIIWNQNPLRTVVEVDDRDINNMLQHIRSEEYSDLLCEIDMDIRGGWITTLDQALVRIQQWERICNIDENDEQLQLMVRDLQGGHAGDCTCFPISCMKCIAEEAVGVCTIRGLGKHSAHKIMSVFQSSDQMTIDEAIRILEAPRTFTKDPAWVKTTQEEFDKHIPRWTREYQEAAKWLKAYKQKHGF